MVRMALFCVFGFWIQFCFTHETLTTVGSSNTVVLKVEHEDPQESLRGGPVSPAKTGLICFPYNSIQ